MALTGWVDGVDDGVVYGWAFDSVGRKSPRLNVELDGEVVGEITGTEFRSDLLAAQIGDGRHGFLWPLPERGELRSASVLTVRFAESGEILHGGERLILRGSVPRSELFGSVLATGMWNPTVFEVTRHKIVVEGWTVPPFGIAVPYTMTHNSMPFANVVRFDRRDVAERFDIPGEGPQFGFSCEMPNADPDATEHEIALVDSRTLKPFNPHHAINYIESDAPIPEAAQRKRVSSNEDIGAFVFIGSSAYTRLDRVLREYFGKSLAQADSVLDWGCGCGRVFRYFPTDRLSHLTGVDIDRDNIEWSRAAYPAARFHVIQPRPPTQLASAGFDVVFGISVFTHLTEENHLEWLDELRRITRPGAAVLVSTHGETAWLLSDRSLARYSEWRAGGYLVVGKNYDLDDRYADTTRYYNAFVSRRYIFETWSRYFRVLAVLDGAIANYQDLVVLERV